MKLKRIVSGRKTEMKILTNLYGEAVKKQAMKILGSESQAEKCKNKVMLMLEESLENLGEYGSSQAKSYIFQLTCCCAEILKGKK